MKSMSELKGSTGDVHGRERDVFILDRLMDCDFEIRTDIDYPTPPCKGVKQNSPKQAARANAFKAEEGAQKNHYAKHQQRLQHVKASLDNRIPQHLSQKQETMIKMNAQRRSQEKTDIKIENCSMVKRMTSIYNRKTRFQNRTQDKAKEIQQHLLRKRQRQLGRIEKANQRLAMKLANAGPRCDSSNHPVPERSKRHYSMITPRPPKERKTQTLAGKRTSAALHALQYPNLFKMPSPSSAATWSTDTLRLQVGGKVAKPPSARIYFRKRKTKRPMRQKAFSEVILVPCAHVVCGELRRACIRHAETTIILDKSASLVEVVVVLTAALPWATTPRASFSAVLQCSDLLDAKERKRISMRYYTPSKAECITIINRIWVCNNMLMVTPHIPQAVVQLANAGNPDFHVVIAGHDVEENEKEENEEEDEETCSIKDSSSTVLLENDNQVIVIKRPVAREQRDSLAVQIDGIDQDSEEEFSCSTYESDFTIASGSECGSPKQDEVEQASKVIQRAVRYRQERIRSMTLKVRTLQRWYRRVRSQRKLEDQSARILQRFHRQRSTQKANACSVKPPHLASRGTLVRFGARERDSDRLVLVRVCVGEAGRHFAHVEPLLKEKTAIICNASSEHKLLQVLSQSYWLPRNVLAKQTQSTISLRFGVRELGSGHLVLLRVYTKGERKCAQAFFLSTGASLDHHGSSEQDLFKLLCSLYDVAL